MKAGMNEMKILIVDDDIDNLNMLIDILEKTNYHTYIATNSETAMELIANFIPDLILLDVMMPGIDGFETCRRLKETKQCEEIPVIFMTALSEPVNKINGFEAGGVDYITKPFDNDEVLARIRTHLSLQGLRRQLAKKNEELEILNSSKDKFLSILAHDLKNPVALFLSTSNLLEDMDKIEPKHLKELVKDLQASAKNMLSLLENLLTWARHQKGDITYSPSSVTIGSIMTWHVNSMRPVADQKGITINNLVKNNIRVYADNSMLNTVFRNLLSNAIKYSNSGGLVEISAKKAGKNVELTVADNGVGIPAEMIGNIFKIDSRFQTNGTADEKGTGLGLILCKNFVEQNGGNIWLESTVGKGTTAKVIIPLQEKPEGENAND